MSVKAMSWVWKHSRAAGNTLLVFLASADHAHDDGTDAWPGQESLAKKCRVSSRTVRRAVEELEQLGELWVERYAGPPVRGRKGQRTHRYTLTFQSDNLSGSKETPVGQTCEPVGQPDPSSRTPVSGEPSIEPLYEPSARDIVHWKEEDLVARMVDHFGPPHAKRSREVIRELLATLDWRVVDGKIGRAIEAGAYSPNFLVGSRTDRAMAP